MNGTQVFWLTMALVCAVAGVTLALAVIRRQPMRPTRTVRTAWLAAATTSGTILTFIAAKAGDLIPNATIVDVAALAVTGVLTGAFLALGLRPVPTSGVH